MCKTKNTKKYNIGGFHRIWVSSLCGQASERFPINFRIDQVLNSILTNSHHCSDMLSLAILNFAAHYQLRKLLQTYYKIFCFTKQIRIRSISILDPKDFYSIIQPRQDLPSSNQKFEISQIPMISRGSKRFLCKLFTDR